MPKKINPDADDTTETEKIIAQQILLSLGIVKVIRSLITYMPRFESQVGKEIIDPLAIRNHLHDLIINKE